MIFISITIKDNTKDIKIMSKTYTEEQINKYVPPGYQEGDDMTYYQRERMRQENSRPRYTQEQIDKYVPPGYEEGDDMTYYMRNSMNN